MIREKLIFLMVPILTIGGVISGGSKEETIPLDTKVQEEQSIGVDANEKNTEEKSSNLEEAVDKGTEEKTIDNGSVTRTIEIEDENGVVVSIGKGASDYKEITIFADEFGNINYFDEVTGKTVEIGKGRIVAN